MRPYIEFTGLPRSLISFWVILLIFGCMSALVLSVLQKRYLITAISVSCGVMLYFMMQVTRNISRWYMGNNLHPFAARVGNIPMAVFVIVLAFLTLAFIIQFYLILRYSHVHITPSAVKEAFDLNPTGICYYRSDGQTILVNHRMNALAFAVTGRGLLNGAELFDAVRDRHIAELPDGSVVRFSHREFVFGGELCHELIADDITELYRKSENLRIENERLKTMNHQMEVYGEHIDETVRQREILNTKTKIHDEMNRLLLSTDKAIRNGTEEEKQQILKTWQENVLLLCIEADSETRHNVISDLDALARIIGVTVVYERPVMTDDRETLHLFYLAAEEAMINAAKHGGAKHLYVNTEENEQCLKLYFTDDGRGTDGLPIEGGGLSALRHRLEEAGGSIRIGNNASFTLIIEIPKGENRNGL